ncbi:MAG: FAD-binding domain-containing protein [Synechococcus sp.]
MAEQHSPLQLVWFKRDLRSVDHRPLLEACAHGPVLPLYIVEPGYWQQPDASARQWDFCRESLQHLRHELAALGQPLVVRCGEAVAVLERARSSLGAAAIWSHEETGNGFTYARDRAVLAWTRDHGIPWIQIPQFGVIRALKRREGWARRWDERMAESLAPKPRQLHPLPDVVPGPIPTADALQLPADPCPQRQLGGREQGLRELDDFLSCRVQHYAHSISSPLVAFRGCSRLSPYLTWGCLSMREVVQATRPHRGRGVSSFGSRLHWHCHFIQKLESEPGIEFHDFHPFMRGIRSMDAERFQAWMQGRTGVPFVDACMRALQAHGWINFRMRAMLMSFASYHLWLPWRDCGLHLARQFVDYEPGIHWSQCQMQSGSTAINTIRIYNPVKQGQDHDPKGCFIRQWCPELASLPDVYLHEPWKLEAQRGERLGCRIGIDYPAPLVDPAAAARDAKDRIWAIRQAAGFDRIADAIQQRHGSRRAGLTPVTTRRRRRSRTAVKDGDQQLQLDL